MAKIEVAGSLNVGTVNTVLDERSRINKLSDVANIPLPAIGALFYCVEDGKTYIIKSLKSKLANGYNIADAEVDQYEEFGGSGKGLSNIYFDVPSEDELESSDFLLIEIDFANNDNFADCVSFTLADCMVFNAAEGVWITPPADGLGFAFCGSKIRLAVPDGDYTLCRYRWKYADDAYVKSSYKVAII